VNVNKNWLYPLLAVAFLLVGSILIRIGFYLGIRSKNMTTTSSLRIGNVLLQGEVVQIQPSWWLFFGIALLVMSAVFFFISLSIARRSRR